MNEIVKFDANKHLNSRVTLSNKLVQAEYKLSLLEFRIIFLSLSMISSGDDDFKEYVIDLQNFARIFKLDGNSFYENLHEAALSLSKKGLMIAEKDATLYTHWLSSIKIPKGKGCIRVRFDPNLKPYLLELQSEFTAAQVKYVLVDLKNAYSGRVYILLRQYLNLNTGERKFEVEKLKRILGLLEQDDKGVIIESYKNYHDFKINVLNKVVTEITKKTDLYVEFEDGPKIGRKVTDVIFSVRRKTEEELKNNNIDIDMTNKKKKKNAESPFVPPSLEEFKAYCANYIFNKDPEIIYDSYAVNDWHDSQGTPIKNWKQKVVQVWAIGKKSKLPETEKKEDKKPILQMPVDEPKDIKDLRTYIKSMLNLKLGAPEDVKTYRRLFVEAKIEKVGEEYTIYILPTFMDDAMKYQQEFITRKLNIKMEVKNVQ